MISKAVKLQNGRQEVHRYYNSSIENNSKTWQAGYWVEYSVKQCRECHGQCLEVAILTQASFRDSLEASVLQNMIRYFASCCLVDKTKPHVMLRYIHSGYICQLNAFKCCNEPGQTTKLQQALHTLYLTRLQIEAYSLKI